MRVQSPQQCTAVRPAERRACSLTLGPKKKKTLCGTVCNSLGLVKALLPDTLTVAPSCSYFCDTRFLAEAEIEVRHGGRTASSNLVIENRKEGEL